MIKLEKMNMKSLRQLAMTDKMKLMRDPFYGERLMSALTPTQIAELFPKYYLRQLPDISGFYKAMPTSMTAARQAAYDQSMGRQTAAPAGASTPASGNLAQNQREAYKAAKAEGLSDSAAKILVANMSGESLKNPSYHHWDVKHMSQGIVQWDPQRAERIKNHFGAYPKDMSVEQQTKAAIWEMKTYYGTSWQALNNENLPPQQRMYTVVSDYERPADVGGAVSNRMGYYNGLGDSVTTVYDTSQATNREQRVREDLKGVGDLSKFAPGSAPAQNDRQSLFDQAGKIAGVEMRQNGSGGGKCGKGARGLAGAMFGSSYFAQGLGGDGTAASLSRGNDYFQRSGLYNNPTAPQGDLNDPTYRASLPVGTVISSGGGNARGEGHVQIKIGPGPNDWASDFNQESKGVLVSNRYHSYMVHTPNQQGQEILSKRNFPMVTGTTAATSTADNPNPVGTNIGPGSQNVQQTQQNAGMAPGAEGMPTALVSPMGIPGMGMPMNMIPGMGMMGAGMDPMMMMQMMSGMMMGGGMGGIGTIAGMAMPIAATAVGALASSILRQNNEGEGSGSGRGHRRRRRHRAHHATASTAPKAEPKDTGPVTPVPHRSDIGFTSAKYESGQKGVHTVSSGKNDPGGVSYGRHQLSSKKGTMGSFLRSPEGQSYAPRFSNAKPGSAEFNRIYKQIATEDPEGFAKAQHEFVTRTHYDPVYRHAKNLGYNVDDPRVQEALYSISVQHGGAKTIVSNAKGSATANPVEQVSALFNARKQYVGRKGMNFDTRYNAEQRDIASMDISKYAAPTTQVAKADTSPIVSAQRVSRVPNFTSPGPTFTETAQRAIGISPAYAEGRETTAPAAAFTPKRVEGNLFKTQEATITPKDKIGADLSKPPSSPLIDQVNRTNMEVQSLRNDMRTTPQQSVVSKPAQQDAPAPNMSDVMNIHRMPFNTPSMERATGRNFPDPHFEYGNNS